MKAAAAAKIEALNKRRSPLLDKKRTRDQTNDSHCLALYASAALALLGAGSPESHTITKRVLRKLRETPRHREKLKHWPRLERAFADYQSNVNSRDGDAPAPSSREETANQESDSGQPAQTQTTPNHGQASHEEPPEHNRQKPPDVVQ